MISILLTLMVIGGGYFFFSSGQGAALVRARVGSSKVSCRSNRAAAERMLQSWRLTHPDRRPSAGKPTPADLHLPECPGGGEFGIVQNRVYCSLHDRESLRRAELLSDSPAEGDASGPLD